MEVTKILSGWKKLFLFAVLRSAVGYRTEIISIRYAALVKLIFSATHLGIFFVCFKLLTMLT